jgi:HEAT repeat protein
LRSALDELAAYDAVRAEVPRLRGLLGDTGLIPRLRKGLSGPEPLVSWADAIALARLGDAGPDVTGVLAAACVEPPEPGPEPTVRFLGGDLRVTPARPWPRSMATCPRPPSTRSWTA